MRSVPIASPRWFASLLFGILLMSAPGFAAASRDNKTEAKDPVRDILSVPAGAVRLAGDAAKDVLFFFPEVIVPGSRIPSQIGDDRLDEAAQDIIVIGEEELDESTGLGLVQSLRRTEGVTYSDDTGLGLNARVDLRGFGGEGKQALVLFDGMRAVEPFDNSVTWHLFPAEYLQQVQVRPGGGSTVYGEGAFSGVIDLQTKNPTPETKLHAEAVGGTFNTQKYFAEMSGTHEKLGVYVGSRYLTTDGYRVNSEHESASALLKAQYPIGDRLQVRNSFYFADNETGIPGPLTRAEMDQDRRQQDPDGQRGDRFMDKLVQDQLTITWANPDSGLEISNVTGYRLRNQDSIQTFGGFFGGTSENEIETETLSNVVQATASIELTRWTIDTALGMEWSLDDIWNGNVFSSAFGEFGSERAIDRRMIGVFLQNDTHLDERWTLETGLRWDDIRWDIYDLKVPSNQKEKKADEVSSRIGLLFKAADWVSIFGSYSESFKAPDANALIFETPNIFAPNPNVDAQTAQHYETGLRGTVGRSVLWKVTGFYVETKKEILFNDITNLNENFDTRRRGVETAVELRVNEQVRLSANHTYARATFDNGLFDGKDVPLTPESRWAAGVEWKPAASWTLSTQASGVHGQWALNDFNNLFPADDYWTLGARAAYRIGAWEFYVSGENLLGEEYASFITSNAVDTVNFNPAPTEYVEFGVKWSG